MLGFPRRREGSAALLSVCTEWVKHRKEWDAERGFFSALRYLCCLGYFFFLVFRHRQCPAAHGLLYVRHCRWMTDRRNGCALGSAGLVRACCDCSWG